MSSITSIGQDVPLKTSATSRAIADIQAEDNVDAKPTVPEESTLSKAHKLQSHAQLAAAVAGQLQSEEGSMNDQIEDKIVDPQVTSSDPNERKLARKLRIERRLEAIRRQALLEGQGAETEEKSIVAQKTLLQEQLEKSALNIEKILFESEEHITNIRVASDSREVDRRELEGINRENVIEKLEKEAGAAREVFEEVSGKWDLLLKHNDPLHINEELIAQKERCDELICQKDSVIAMLKAEITTSDKKFSEDQLKQNDDIYSLTKRIEQQVQRVRRAFREELMFLEETLATERRLRLETNDKRWDELYKKRDQEERAIGERRVKMLEEFDEEMTRLRISHQEKYRQTKIKLENDVEEIQREFERIKATALMNSEKMDYNYQILRKREDENIIMKSQQKRRINKLQDVYNELRRTITKYEKDTSEELLKLHVEVFNLQKCVIEQETKAITLCSTNDAKYWQVWELNTKQARDVLDKILTIDQLIYEQELGMEWKKNSKELLTREALPSYRAAHYYLSGEKLGSVGGPGGAGSDHSMAGGGKAISFKLGKQGRGRDPTRERRLLMNILDQISTRTGFLIEDRLRTILEPYTTDEITLVRIDNIFAALGVRDKTELEYIVDYFLPYTFCPFCTKSLSPSMKHLRDSSAKASRMNVSETPVSQSLTEESGSSVSSEQEQPNVLGDIILAVQQPSYVIEDIVRNLTYMVADEGQLELVEEEEHFTESSLDERMSSISGSDPSSGHARSNTTVTFRFMCKHKHALMINPVYVLKALKEYISHHVRAQQVSMSKRRTTTTSRELHDDDMQEYWNRFKLVFSDAKERLWDGLMTGYKKYHEILLDRKKLYEEVEGLRKRNKELNDLYEKYASQVEHRPPCAKQSSMYRESPVHNVASIKKRGIGVLHSKSTSTLGTARKKFP